MHGAFHGLAFAGASFNSLMTVKTPSFVVFAPSMLDQAVFAFKPFGTFNAVESTKTR